MRKLNSLKLLLSALLLAIGCHAWGENVTLDIAGSGKWTNKSVTNNGVTMTITKGDLGTSDSQTRLSEGAAFTITAPTGKKVKGATITTNSTNTYVAPLATPTSTYTGCTCTVSSKTATITVNSGKSIICTNLGGAIRVTTCVVTIEEDSGSDPVDASWSVEPENVSVKENKTATATITTDYDGTLSVKSNATGTATATISNKVITVKGVAAGTTTLTVTGAATSNYNAISKTISVTVTANIRPAGEIFYESFDTNSGTGGNDGQWSGSIASNKIQSDSDGWTFTKGSGASECAKFGTGSALGSAITPALGHEGSAILTFKAAAWNSKDENTTLKLSVENGGSISSATVTLIKGQWTVYTLNLSNLTDASKVKFEGYEDSYSRFFLDEVFVIAPTTYTLSTADDDFYTLFLPFETTIPSTAKVYAAKLNDTETELALTAVEGTLPANSAVLVKRAGAEADLVFAPSATGAEALTNNSLKGVFVDTEYSELAEGGKTLLTLNTTDEHGVGFYLPKDGATTLKANRAYLLVTTPKTPAPVRIVMPNDVATAIENNSEAVKANKTLIDGRLYILRDGNMFDLNGRLVK